MTCRDSIARTSENQTHNLPETKKHYRPETQMHDGPHTQWHNRSDTQCHSRPVTHLLLFHLLPLNSTWYASHIILQISNFLPFKINQDYKTSNHQTQHVLELFHFDLFILPISALQLNCSSSSFVNSSSFLVCLKTIYSLSILPLSGFRWHHILTAIFHVIISSSNFVNPQVNPPNCCDNTVAFLIIHPLYPIHRSSVCWTTWKFLATKRLNKNTETRYKTVYQYNQTLKQHEAYLDAIFLAKPFQ